MVQPAGSAASRGYDARWRALVRLVLERDGYRCRWCGAPATEGDHVVPLADGGAVLDPANVVASCGPCNRRRGGQLGARRRAGSLAPGSGFLADRARRVTSRRGPVGFCAGDVVQDIPGVSNSPPIDPEPERNRETYTCSYPLGGGPGPMVPDSRPGSR